MTVPHYALVWYTACQGDSGHDSKHNCSFPQHSWNFPLERFFVKNLFCVRPQYCPPCPPPNPVSSWRASFAEKHIISVCQSISKPNQPTTNNFSRYDERNNQERRRSGQDPIAARIVGRPTTNPHTHPKRTNERTNEQTKRIAGVGTYR